MTDQTQSRLGVVAAALLASILLSFMAHADHVDVAVETHAEAEAALKEQEKQKCLSD